MEDGTSGKWKDENCRKNAQKTQGRNCGDQGAEGEGGGVVDLRDESREFFGTGIGDRR